MKIAFLTLLVVCLLLICVIIVICYFFRKKCNNIEDIKNWVSELHSISNIDQLIEVLLDIIRTKGYKTYGFFRKNIPNKCLENGYEYIPAFERSAATKAFFRGKPFYLDKNLNSDEIMIKKFGGDTCFVPISIIEDDCWVKHNCYSKTCKCYGKSNPDCWLNSGKEFRGREMQSYNDKIEKCFKCASFRPFGVFAVKGKRPVQLMRFLNENFSGVLKKAVLYGRAQQEATQDKLTNILNKNTFFDRVNFLYKMAFRYNEPLSLGMLEIDHFNRINDNYGHSISKTILKELSSLIKRSIRDTDIIARYGYEEFTIVLPKTPKEVAFGVFDKIRQKVQDNIFETALGTLNVRISIGFCTLPDDEISSLQDMIEKADRALYQSKTTSNTVTAFNKSLPEKSLKIRKMKRYISDSIEEEIPEETVRLVEKNMETSQPISKKKSSIRNKKTNISSNNIGNNDPLPSNISDLLNKDIKWSS